MAGAAPDERLGGGYVTTRLASGRDICPLCAQHAAVDSWFCRRCYADLVAGFHRRRAAALRCQPMKCGARDPITCGTGAA